VNEVKSARGKVTIDQGTNMIIIKDEKESLEDAKVLIATIDEATQEIATRQVMIEARIVEADSSFTRASPAPLQISQSICPRPA
jgi:type IV pilus assembly protein PilQ